MMVYIGTVRFSDGQDLFGLYQGTLDRMERRLYLTVEEAEAARDGPVRMVPPVTVADGRDEPVLVFPYVVQDPSSNDAFPSRASQEARWLTGPCSAEAVLHHREDDGG